MHYGLGSLEKIALCVCPETAIVLLPLPYVSISPHRGGLHEVEGLVRVIQNDNVLAYLCTHGAAHGLGMGTRESNGGSVEGA